MLNLNVPRLAINRKQNLKQSQPTKQKPQEPRSSKAQTKTIQKKREFEKQQKAGEKEKKTQCKTKNTVEAK